MGLTPVYAEAEEVMDLVRDPSKKPGVDYVIVDVRGEDYKVTLNPFSLSCVLSFFFLLGWPHSWFHQHSSKRNVR